MTSPRWPAWANAAALLMVSFVALASLSLRVGPGTEVVAVSFPLWWSAQQRLAAAASADVAIVRLTGVPAVVVARAGDEGGIARLRRAGAWRVINPVAIAGCFAGESGISK
jgi:hypothetical protein